MSGGAIEMFPILEELPTAVKKRLALMKTWFDKAVANAQTLRQDLPVYENQNQNQISHVYRIDNEKGRIGCLFKRYDPSDAVLGKVEASLYLLDHPMDIRRSDRSSSVYGFFGVLPTFFLRYPAGTLDDLELVGVLVEFIEDAVSIGKFVSSGGDTKTVTEDDKQRIALLDIRFCNIDRHKENILLKERENNTSPRVIPIDHEMCLHTGNVGYHLGKTCWKDEEQLAFEDVLSKPFSGDSVEYVMKMNADEDLELLKRCGWIPDEAAYQEKLKVITMFIKKAVAVKFDVKKIAKLTSMEDVECLDSAVGKIVKGGDDYFSRVDKALDELVRLKL